MRYKNSFIAAGLIFGLMIFRLSSSYAELAVSQKAPEFNLSDLEGKNISLVDALKDKKAVLLNFWATWCPACKHEIPDLIELQQKYSSKGFSILGIDVGESVKRVSVFKEKFSINYPILLDPGSDAAQEYGVVGLPLSVLVDSEGNILGTYHEFSDALVLEVKRALS